MKLEKWCLIARNSLALLAPEQERACLHGFVYGHPRCADGKEVTTSLVVARDGTLIVTKSGSAYELGDADSGYEGLFPNARQRMLSSLRPAKALAEAPYEI